MHGLTVVLQKSESIVESPEVIEQAISFLTSCSSYHRRLSFLVFDVRGFKSFNLVSVMQYLSRILTVSLSTGRDFDKDVLTDLVRVLH